MQYTIKEVEGKFEVYEELTSGTMIRMCTANTQGEAEQEIKLWEARDKVIELTQDMDIFDTIWHEVEGSGLDEGEVRQIIRDNI